MKYEDIYIAGPLTNLHESEMGLKQIYEEVGNFLSDRGCNVHIPHLRTDPINFPNLSPQEVWELDIKAITKSDVLIAFVGIPSLGVGQELEAARAANKDLILWSWEGQKVSRMALGNPKVVCYMQVKDIDDLKNNLANFF